mgnify:CR=1 FL=1
MTKIYDFENIGNNKFCQENNIKLEWEKEVLTEFKTYQYLINNKIQLPLGYIAYPWALLIDLYGLYLLGAFGNAANKAALG